MRVVGVKELKAKLSAYLREVRRGEVFLVTDRDRVVAELRPPRLSTAPPADDLERSIEALVDAGELTLPRRSSQGWSWQARGLGLPDGTAQRILDELRTERSESDDG